ncbi:YidH family protein [Demequina sp.]|uniref:YidH family protein n=1 Tax=Demequina sp. TaxID=2050685 RepID=UPI003A8B1172
MSDTPRSGSFPRRVYDVGEAPDARFSMANERTYLAWIRTALGLFATGVGLEALEAPLDPMLRLVAATGLSALGIIACAYALYGWARTERALRTGRPLPRFRLGPVLTGGIILCIGLVAVGLLL